VPAELHVRHCAPLQVHLNDKVQQVVLRSGGGDVSVTVSPSISAVLQVDCGTSLPLVGPGEGRQPHGRGQPAWGLAWCRVAGWQGLCSS
jgi:hypothetical protein